MQRSENVNELFTALSKLQGNMTNAYKDKAGHGYNYAELSQVIEISKEKLEECGLAITQCPTSIHVIEFDTHIDGKTEKEGIINYQVHNKKFNIYTDKMVVPMRVPVQKLWTEIQHSSGQWIAFEMEIILEKGAGMSWAQATGSVITYARRYSRAAMTGITQTDNDGSIQHEENNEIIDAKELERLTQLMESTNTDANNFAKFLEVSDIKKLPKKLFNKAERALSDKERKMNISTARQQGQESTLPN